MLRSEENKNVLILKSIFSKTHKYCHYFYDSVFHLSVDQANGMEMIKSDKKYISSLKYPDFSPDMLYKSSEDMRPYRWIIERDFADYTKLNYIKLNYKSHKRVHPDSKNIQVVEVLNSIIVNANEFKINSKHTIENVLYFIYNNLTKEQKKNIPEFCHRYKSNSYNEFANSLSKSDIQELFELTVNKDEKIIDLKNELLKKHKPERFKSIEEHNKEYYTRNPHLRKPKLSNLNGLFENFDLVKDAISSNNNTLEKFLYNTRLISIKDLKIGDFLQLYDHKYKCKIFRKVLDIKENFIKIERVRKNSKRFSIV